MTPEEHVARAEELVSQLDQCVNDDPARAVALAGAAQVHYQAAATLVAADAMTRTMAAVEADQDRAQRAERAQQVYAGLGQEWRPER